jgi:cytochrome c oxidase subunit II
MDSSGVGKRRWRGRSPRALATKRWATRGALLLVAFAATAVLAACGGGPSPTSVLATVAQPTAALAPTAPARSPAGVQPEETLPPSQAPTAQQQGTEAPSIVNGRQIYFTATSQRGSPITSDLQMGMMGGGMMTCATCHGPDGRGGQVTFMMQYYTAPDIRHKTLTSNAMQDHPPYTDETIKRAITQGLDPGGDPLQYPMPRWTMSAADLDDLVAFLKTLN